MSPWIIGFCVFTLYPVLSSLYFSFTSYDLLGTPEWVGLANYRFMFTKDPLFWLSVRNTLWIIVFALPIRIAFAMFTAYMLTRATRGWRTYRTLFFLPTMVPAVAAALAFVYLFNPAVGPINVMLGGLGVDDPPLWFRSAEWSKPALLLLALWGVGDAMIIFLAGMLDVPRQLYEAAEIEGARAWQKFRYVTFPLITPVLFFSLVMGVIDGFQYFTQAYVASNQGQADSIGWPENSLLFYSVNLYRVGFQNFKMGYASAMAWVLLVIILLCTLVIMRSSRRWVHYQGGSMFR
jgi:multiple sugar transport system permease protein